MIALCTAGGDGEIFEVQFLHLSPQRRFVDSQFPGGGGALAAVAFQRVTDVPWLDLAQGGASRDTAGKDAGIMKRFRQVTRFDPAAGTEDKGVLDRVFKLANVTRPVVAHKGLH